MIRWTFELLDSLDRPTGTLDGVTGGWSEVVAQAELGGSGELVVDERGQGIDWMKDRVRAVYTDSELVLVPEVGHWEGGGSTWVVDVPGSTVNHPATVVLSEGFETTDGGWVAKTNSTVTRTSGSGAHSGTWYIYTVGTAAGAFSTASTLTGLTVGASYTLGAWVGRNATSVTAISMGVTGVGASAPVTPTSTLVADTHLTFTFTATATTHEVVVAGTSTQSGRRIYLDDFSVTADAWSESIPEVGHWETTPAVWVVDEPAGVREVSTSFPVGTFLLSSPKEDHSDTGVTYTVGLLTKMNIVAEDTVEDRYSVSAGTLIIPTVQALIESTGETRIAVTASDVTLGAALTWEAGTSKLRIINDLLQAAGYWSLWCDGSGQFRVERYVDPASRPVAYSFEHGESSVHFPDWSRVQDMASVPNRFIAVGQGDEDTAPLVGVATNENPESPFSFQARGRWITATEEGVEAESQDIIDAYAARKLRDAMSPVSRLTVTHKMLDLEPNQLVEFIPEDGVRRLATIQKMRVSFDDFTDVDAEWREVQ